MKYQYNPIKAYEGDINDEIEKSMLEKCYQNMMKAGHSDKVSRKIALLVNEGKPQKQAVAIALNMEREGKL